MKRRIITTRPEEKVDSTYSGDCLEVVNIPVTKLVTNSEIDIESINNFNPTIGVFTSTKGVNIFLSIGPEKWLSGMKVVAIGEKTAGILSSQYGKVFVPERKTSRGVNELLDGMVNREDRIVLFTSSKSNGIILDHLERRGWRYISIELYDAVTLDIEPLITEISKDECIGIVVTSSMEARALFHKEKLKTQTSDKIIGKHIFAIGKTTEETLRELNIPISEPIGNSNLEELLRNIEKIYCKQK